ncbi:DUF1653 domain-containing protein [Candidatus Kaiserbacteria bacterium]|nr:DUF1653 domain-containing protein [Candidatus Kaiserbacteria bacterium]
MHIPQNFPEKGFYYHYKHDPNGSLGNYAYEVLGVARHTEDETYLVMYRPLYKNTYFSGLAYSARPLDMFMEDVTKDGETIPRFQLITDSEITSKLGLIKRQMYGNSDQS